MSFFDEYKNVLDISMKRCIRFSSSDVGGKYEYLPISHYFIPSWSDDMFDLLATNLIQYCYYESELDSKGYYEIKKIKDYIKDATRERLNERIVSQDTDGLCGELLIDLFVRANMKNSKTLLCRPLYQELNNKQELKNYDLMLFEKNDNGKINLILGQSKSGLYESCQQGIVKDLNTKYNNPYFGNAMCYVKERSFAHMKDNGLDEILKQLNKITLSFAEKSLSERNNAVIDFIKNENIKIVIPCLLFYTNKEFYNIEKQFANCNVIGFSDNFIKSKDMDEKHEIASGVVDGNVSTIKRKVGFIDIDKKMSKEIEKVKKYFESRKFDICDVQHEIVFYVFPCDDVAKIRQKMCDYKKEVFEKVG